MGSCKQKKLERPMMSNTLEHIKELLELITPETCAKIGAGEELRIEEKRALLNLISLTRRLLAKFWDL